MHKGYETQVARKPARIGDVLHNYKGEVLYMCSKHLGIKGTNEAKVLAFLEALWSFSLFFLSIVIGGVTRPMLCHGFP